MENKQLSEIYNVIHKIEAIHLLGGKISDYLTKQGIKSVTLVGHSELIKIVCLDLIYTDNVLISQIYADDVDESCKLKFINKELKINRMFENNMKIDDNFVLVCTPKKDKSYNANIIKNKNVEIIDLSFLVDECFVEYFYYLPLEKIKNKNPNVPICILHNPSLQAVKSKSEYEEYLLAYRTKHGHPLRMLRENPPQIMESIKRISTDIEYAREITGNRTMSKINGIYKVDDKHGAYVNVNGGFRLTADQPDEYDGIVYTFGHSVIFGRGAEDKDTIQSHLQRIFNQYAKDNNTLPKLVLNCSNISSSDYIRMFPYMESFKFNKNDIVVLSSYSSYYAKNDRNHGYVLCETQYAFERPHNMGEIFVDHGVHINSFANKKIAELLFATFQENCLLTGEYKCQNNFGKVTDNRLELKSEYAEELHDYKLMLSRVHSQTLGKIGAIVMNCNPFTLGHRYLIEQAASQVRHLYIFAVEEDKSIFPFADRFELMKAGTADLPNVTVLPSGKFIISSLTFKDYFNKAELQDQTIDPSMDVSLFAKEISPVLDITVRFAGEEPLDMVTKQYNDTMRRILPEHGIEFVEISRKEFDGEVISASRVRRLLEEKDFDCIAEIVPDTTLAYLINRFS